MLRSEPLTAESLLETHTVELHIDKECCALEDFGITDTIRRFAANIVAAAVAQHGLELDPTKDKIALILRGTSPSAMTEGTPCIDVQARVMFFTTRGPKHVDSQFAILAENAKYMSEGGDA